MAYWPPEPDVYKDAIRTGLACWYTVDANLRGQSLATDLRPTGGSITDTTKPGVRRVLSLELAPERGLFDLLSPVGTELHVYAHVRYTNRTVVDIPMGVFDVDSERISEGGGVLSLTAPDKWVRVQRSKFVGPTSSIPGETVTNQIKYLIQGALGIFEPVNVTTSNMTPVGALTWEKDRDAAINDLAKSIGCWVYFDRNGVCTIADIPTAGPQADWLVDASASGVLTELTRERSRTNTYNVVVVSSSASGGEKHPSNPVWDDDPTSPTWAGPDPINHPDLAGPFGVSTYFYDSPTTDSLYAARQAGLAILSRTVGLASTVSLGQVPNPAVDAFDVLDVLPPAERVTTVTLRTVDPVGSLYPSPTLYPSPSLYPSGGVQVPVLSRNSTGAILERHVADTVTHPLVQPMGNSGGNPMQIEGRSTRTDEYT